MFRCGALALKSFLRWLPVDSPVTFILAQHMGQSFAPSPLDQWNCVTSLIVTLAEETQLIPSEEVDTVSADQRFLLTAERLVRFTSGSISSIHRPCVDEVMMRAANRFEARTGAIVFVSMGEDGADDGRCTTDRGRIV